MIFTPLKPGVLTGLIMSEADMEAVMVNKDIKPLNAYVRKAKFHLVEIKELPCSPQAKWDAMTEILDMVSDTFNEISDAVDFRALADATRRFQNLRRKYRQRYSQI